MGGKGPVIPGGPVLERQVSPKPFRFSPQPDEDDLPIRHFREDDIDEESTNSAR